MATNTTLDTISNSCIPVIRIKMIREKGTAYSGQPIKTSRRAAKVLKEFFEDLDREALFVLCLSTDKRPTGINLVCLGSLNAAHVEAREVFKPAILSNAASIVLAHNHPSGNLEISQSDLRITRRIHKAGRYMGILLDDHLILSPEGGWVSLGQLYPEAFSG